MKNCPELRGGLVSRFVFFYEENRPRDRINSPYFPNCPYVTSGLKDRQVSVYIKDVATFKVGFSVKLCMELFDPAMYIIPGSADIYSETSQLWPPLTSAKQHFTV